MPAGDSLDAAVERLDARHPADADPVCDGGGFGPRAAVECRQERRDLGGEDHARPVVVNHPGPPSHVIADEHAALPVPEKQRKVPADAVQQAAFVVAPGREHRGGNSLRRRGPVRDTDRIGVDETVDDGQRVAIPGWTERGRPSDSKCTADQRLRLAAVHLRPAPSTSGVGGSAPVQHADDEPRTVHARQPSAVDCGHA